MKSYRVRVSPKSSAGVPQRKPCTDSDMHRADGQVKIGSDQSDVATSQGMPKIAKSHGKFGTKQGKTLP